MNLLGEFKYNGTDFFIHLNDVSNTETYTLVSTVHADDRIRSLSGEEFKYPVLRYRQQVGESFNLGYVVECVRKHKKTGRILKYGNSNVLHVVLDAVKYAKGYGFSRQEILTSYREIQDGVECVVFDAADSNVQLNYETENGLYKYLRVSAKNVTVELSRVSYNLKLKGLLLEELKNQRKNQYLVSMLEKIDYEALCRVLDMGWYRSDGKLLKDYQSISSIEDFELKIMTPMVKGILNAQKEGRLFDVAIDTETTGLNVYNLSKDNPAKDHCVAIPVCWEFGHSFVIFTDMEHFPNVDGRYVVNRFCELFENFEGEREVVYYEGAAGSSALGGIHKAVIKREAINTIGHNSGFDARVFFDFGKKLYFNQDTLQMAFDISPDLVRGSKKLKILTRYFFHAETPELSDVLGKGNEDKYRYLEDREVAEIYGCADADFTLGCFYELKKLMEPRLFEWYQKQDVPLVNILAYSEYWGMMTYGDEVLKLAKNTRESIEILKQSVYSYVGVYVQYTNDISTLKAKYDAGMFESKQEFLDAVASVVPDENAVYEFEFKPAQLKHVLFDIMKYPVKAYTKGKNPQIKLDKWVIDKLLADNLNEGEKPFRELQKDILVYGADYEEYLALKEKNKKAAQSLVLISAEEFNRKRYPLALVIQKYSELNKEYTSYYKPIENENLESKIFKGYNMARIKTRRISNPGQTMKGNLKALVKAYDDDSYVLDFDMSQVEQRIMVSLSHYTELIEKMRNPEKDAHTETASMVESKPPHKITKKERKAAKSVTFGKPFGLGLKKLCEKMFGDTTEEHMVAAAITSNKWERNNAPIVRLMEDARAQALTEWKINDSLRNFIGAWKKDSEGEYLLDDKGRKIPVPVGRVTNILGFYRTFSLEGIDLSPEGVARRATGDYTPEEASIRRQAGNYPIQATAAELFRQILIRFYNACGKYGIQEKVKWHMLVHDELLCSVKNDVHPFMLYKIVKEACMFTLKGHTNYYVGINIGDNWEQCKEDSREAPIYFVDRMVARYDAGEFEEGIFKHPWDFIEPFLKQYFEDRIGEVIRKYQPDIDSSPVDTAAIIEKFSNYTVRAYVGNYPVNGKVDYVVDRDDTASVAYADDLEWVKRLESWALDVYGEGKEFIGLDGKKYAIHRAAETVDSSPVDGFGEDFEDRFEDGFEDEEDSYWSFDENSASIVYGSVSEDQTMFASADDGMPEFEYDFTKGGNNVTDITITKTRYRNLKVLNHQVMVRVASYPQLQGIKHLLSDAVTAEGNRVIFVLAGTHERWERIKTGYNLDELDAVIDTFNEDFVMKCIGNKVIIKGFGRKEQRLVEEVLSRYRGTDKTIYFEGDTIKKSVSFSMAVSIGKLGQMLEKIRRKVV